MKNIFLLSLALTLTLFACEESQPEAKDPTACECYEDSKLGSVDSPLHEICMQKINDIPEFKVEFSKCQYAELTGKDPKDVVIPEKKDQLELKIPANGTYNVITDKSEMRWVGKKFTGDQHSGTVGIQSGSITVADGKVSSANFVIDMAAITDRSIQDAEKKEMLIGHLKSPDFFDVENHPTATFNMTGGEMGNFKGEITGDLTIKGITKPAKIDLVISQTGGANVVASGSMIFDRTEYDIKYKSQSIFSDLGDAAIRDKVPMSFSIQATAAGE